MDPVVVVVYVVVVAACVVVCDFVCVMISGHKSCCFCLPTIPADCNLFNNHRYKSMVGGNYNVSVFYKNASAPGPEGVVLCNTFK